MTFQERKAARIAANRAGATYRFDVRESYVGWQTIGEGVDRVAGSFSSRREAEEFARHGAANVMHARYAKINRSGCYLDMRFDVIRIEVNPSKGG